MKVNLFIYLFIFSNSFCCGMKSILHNINIKTKDKIKKKYRMSENLKMLARYYKAKLLGCML